MHLRFARFWSEFFRRLTYTNVFRDGYDKRPDVLVFPEQERDGAKSTGVTIVETDDVMFVDVVASDSILKSVVALMRPPAGQISSGPEKLQQLASSSEANLLPGGCAQ